MPTRLNPYLNFSDNTKEVMSFYHSVFGGNLTMTTFGEAQMSDDPADRDKIMHAMLESDSGLVLMASDPPTGMQPSMGNAFSLSLSGDDETELSGYWDKLVDGGTVGVPLEKSPWGDLFGMCTDRFGVSWMVNITAS